MNENSSPNRWISAHSDLRKLMELRMTLELFAARQICDRLSAGEQLEPRLCHALQVLKQAAGKGDHEMFCKADYLLHSTIIELADTPLLNDMWQQLWNSLHIFYRDSLDKHWPDLRVLIAEHEHLVQAICSSDRVAAEDGIRHHLEAIWFRLADQNGETPGGNDPLQRAVAYVAFHFHRPLKLETVAREIAYTSPGHLSNLFRKYYGEGFQSFLQNRRLNQAAELLKKTSLPVAKIASRVGYHDVPRFGQHFKRRFNKTPTQWRKQQQ